MAGEPQVFRYEKPNLDQGKASVWLCRSDITSGYIQVLTEGGENNLHAHPANEGFWFVLGGRARFYGEGDVLLADLGTHEGILIPRGFRYWFESASPEALEIMRVGSTVLKAKDERIDYTPQTAAVYASKHLAPAAPEKLGAVAVGAPPADWVR